MNNIRDGVIKMSDKLTIGDWGKLISRQTLKCVDTLTGKTHDVIGIEKPLWLVLSDKESSYKFKYCKPIMKTYKQMTPEECHRFVEIFTGKSDHKDARIFIHPDMRRFRTNMVWKSLGGGETYSIGMRQIDPLSMDYLDSIGVDQRDYIGRNMAIQEGK